MVKVVRGQHTENKRYKDENGREKVIYKISFRAYRIKWVFINPYTQILPEFFDIGVTILIKIVLIIIKGLL